MGELKDLPYRAVVRVTSNKGSKVLLDTQVRLCYLTILTIKQSLTTVRYTHMC